MREVGLRLAGVSGLHKLGYHVNLVGPVVTKVGETLSPVCRVSDALRYVSDLLRARQAVCECLGGRHVASGGDKGAKTVEDSRKAAGDECRYLLVADGWACMWPGVSVHPREEGVAKERVDEKKTSTGGAMLVLGRPSPFRRKRMTSSQARA